MFHYVEEFSHMGEKGYQGLIGLDRTPEQPWQAYLDEEEPRDFFSVKLRDQKSGETRLLFTMGSRHRIWHQDGRKMVGGWEALQ